MSVVGVAMALAACAKTTMVGWQAQGFSRCCFDVTSFAFISISTLAMTAVMEPMGKQ